MKVLTEAFQAYGVVVNMLVSHLSNQVLNPGEGNDISYC